MAKKNAYSILNVAKEAKPEEIKQAYIQLVKRFDPEKHTDRFMVIQKAYESLNDPRKRAHEDVFAFNAVNGQFMFTDAERQPAPPDPELDSHIDGLLKRGEELAKNDALKEQAVTLLMMRSWRKVKARAWQDAIKDWTRLLDIDPSHHRTKNNLTYALSQMGYSYAMHDLFEEAAEVWERALRLNPDDIKVIHNLALAYENSKNKEKAREYWDEVINKWKAELNKNPDDPYMKQRLVEVYSFQGDQAMKKAAVETPQAPAEARKEYTEALRIQPEDFKAKYQIALTLINERKFKEGIAELTALREKHPKNTEVLNLLGWCYINSGQHERAFRTWRRSLSLDPNNQETKQHIIKARMQLAESLRRQGQFTIAMVHYKELQRMLPKSEEVLYEIAQTFKMKGDKRSAEREYRRVIEMNPANKGALKALSEIRMGH